LTLHPDAPVTRERVLLIGNYGNGNVGDDAILTQMAPLVLEHGQVTVLSRHPQRIIELVSEVHAESMVSTRALLAFLRADTIVIGGGGMFGRGLPPLVAWLPFVLLAAQLLGKDVELRAVGAYSDMPTPVAWALRRVVRRARHVSARDAASVEALGGADLVTLVPDPAWALQPAGPEAVEPVLLRAGVADDLPLVAVSLKPGSSPGVDEHCLDSVARGLDRWARDRDCQFLFMSFSDKGDYRLGDQLTDYHLGRKLQEKMSEGARVRFIGPGLHPAVMLGVVQRCAAMVAMRLHAQIFALVVDRPVYGISFEAKSDQLLTSVGIEPVRPDQVSADGLGRWLEKVAPGQPAR
jgi:polysaccharide pyruvyl transferase WcaK-like protein